MADITLMPMPNLLHRLRSRTPSGSARTRPVPPPSLRTAPASRWGRIVFWLTAPDALGAATAPDGLPAVREAFRGALVDLDDTHSHRLAARLREARTLRELWHLRADVFHVVSLQHGQAEAARRVAGLDRHFARRRGLPA